MDTKPICPVCQKILAPDTPLGLCPECLIRAGFNTGTEPRPADEKKPRFIPPTTAELAKHFPQLEILELIGQGGMGAVYKARQKQLDRAVALKILPPQVASGPGFAERFTREVRALAKLNHPHIVTLYEFGQTDGLFYFLMEYVDGVNLRQLLNHSRLTPKEALSIVPQICDALQYAHDRGIVHRDIKPENIILSKDGEVKIADFGVAKIIGQESAGADTGSSKEPSELTESGSVLGTPQYMAPEQISSPGEVDHRADIYALGVVFYQMLTGELPDKQLQPPSRKVQIDVRLDEIVLRALEKKPELRYQQASELKTQVETMVVTPPRPSSPEEDKSKTMNKKTIAAIAVIALLLTAIGYASWPTITKTDPKGPAVSGPAQINPAVNGEAAGSGLTPSDWQAQHNPENQATVNTTNEGDCRLSIELRDGSHVVGKNLEETLRFHSASLGDMKLAVSGIRSIAMADDDVTARLEATNGDALDVQFITQTLKVETGFGKTELPVKLIKSIRVSAASNPGQIPSGLVALWSGEGNANDSIGGNNGAVTAGTVTYAPAKVGQGFNFDGGANRITVPDAPQLNFGANQDFSIDAWIRMPPNAGSGNSFGVMSIVDKRIASGFSDSPNGYEFSLNNGHIDCRFGSESFISPGPDLRDGLFHHVALTVSRNSTTGGKLYADGVVVMTFDPTFYNGSLINAEPLRIGNHAALDLNCFFNGVIDEVGIYNRALSADEIQTIYDSANSIISVPPPANPPKPIFSATATNETGFRLTIDLQDGSRVAGKSLEQTLRFHSASLGDMKLAVSGIRSIVMADDGVTAKVTTSSGDVLDVQFVTQTLKVETGFGKTELPVKLIRSIRVAAAGKLAPTLPGLVALWSGEGNANDSTGVNNGVPGDGVSFEPGVVGQAFHFNGNDNSYVKVADSPSLRLTDVLTISFWFKKLQLNDRPYGEFIINKGGDWTRGGLNYGVATDIDPFGSTISFLFSGGNRHAGSITDTNWHHCAVVAANGQPDPVFYIDGVIQPISRREGSATINLYPSPAPLYIGAQVDSNSGICYYSKTLIDELAIYNRALTAGEIQSIYNSGNPSIPVPPPAIRHQPNLPTSATATNETGFRLTIDLRDGSHVVGKNLEDALQFHSASLGDMKLAVSGIRSIVMADDGVTAKVTTSSGDVLDVQFVTQTLKVETGFGKTELPVKLIKSIRISAMSKPGQMPSGLVALWSGEGNANDSVGGNNGQLVGSMGFMPGKVGQAFNFNSEIGTVIFPPHGFGYGFQDFRLNRSGGYGYVQIPASPSLDVGKGDGFTFECWIKPVSVTQQMLIAEYERALGTYDWADVGFNVAIHPSSVLDFNLVDDTANHSAHEIITPPNLLVANVWQHIALTYDKASGIAVIYINGAVAVQSNLGSFTPQTGFPYLLVGARTTFGSASNPHDVFSGGMDEIGIYNCALTADEIQSIYNSGNSIISVPPPASPPQPNLPTSATATNETDFRLTIELRDGSRVAGKSLDDTLRFHSASLGDMKLAVSGIRSIVMADDGVTAKVTTSGGDVLDVQFVTPALRVETGFGKTELPVKLIKSIRVAAAGKLAPTPPGLVALWSGEGNANDIVGGNNGTLQGDTTFAPGEVGQAFSFNASASSSVRIPYAPSLITPGYTVETWINPTAQVSGGIGQSVIFGQPYGQAQLLVRTGTTGVLVAFQFGISHFTFYNVQSTHEIPIGQFTHIAGTWDGTTLRLYINGVLNAQNTPGAIPVDSGCDFFIGGFNTPEAGACQYAGQFFQGLVDEVSFYNHALSADEIQTIYNSGNPIISVPPPGNPPQPDLPTPATATNETGFRLTIDLRDGSDVVGKSLEDALQFHSASLGDMKLAVSDIRSIVMAEDGATAKVTTTGGDVLDVQFVTQTLKVETGFGKTDLPVKLIRSIKISCLGKSGYLPPGLVGAWLDDGNGYDSRNGRAAVIEVPNSPALASMQQTHQLSFAAWIKPKSFPCEFPGLLVKGSTTQHDATFGGYVFTLNANGDNDLQFLSGALQIVTHNADGRWINNHLGQWIHVAFTLDAVTRTAKFYVNGKPTDDEFVFGTWDGLNLDVPSKLFVGSGDPANGPNPIFDGQMQDMFLFNRALSADEIQTIYHADQPGDATP